MFQNLGNTCNVLQQSGPVAAGTSNINGNVIDMLGFEGILCIVSLGTLTATQNTKLKWQGGTKSDGSDMTDLANTGNPPGASTYVPDGDSNKFLVSDLVKPIPYRYVRPVVLRGTANSVINSIYCVQYDTKRSPVQTGLRDTNLSGSVVTTVEPKAGTAN